MSDVEETAPPVLVSQRGTLRAHALPRPGLVWRIQRESVLSSTLETRRCCVGISCHYDQRGTLSSSPSLAAPGDDWREAVD